MTSEQAAKLIGDLAERDLGVTVEPERLLAFIRNRWDRIAPLSHRVHAEPDETKDHRKHLHGQMPAESARQQYERDLDELEALGIQNAAALCAREPIITEKSP
jgi:hypothetical protein